MQNVCKMYVNIMQKNCKNYAKSTQKIMQKGYSHALHTHIYIEYARHGENTGLLFGTWHFWHLAFGTWHFWHLAFGNWHFWHLALLALATFGTFGTFG